MVNRKHVSDHISYHVALEEIGKHTALPGTGQGERVIFLFWNVGFSPHLGSKYFSTVPVLYVSLFLLDFVHKIYQSVISITSFCVGTIMSSRANIHKSQLSINLNSREMPILVYCVSFCPLELNQQILGMTGASEIQCVFPGFICFPYFALFS